MQDNSVNNKAFYNLKDGIITVNGDLDINQKVCLIFREKAHEYLHLNQGVNYKQEDNIFIATAISYRLSEKLNIKNDSLDFTKLLDALKEKGMDEKQLLEISKEIDSGYKAISREFKELEVQKDSPQIDVPVIKTEKER